MSCLVFSDNFLWEEKMALEKKPWPVEIIDFHEGAYRHIDDSGCLWLARTRPEAEIWFPGVSKAKIVFGGTGGEIYNGKTGDQLLAEDRILPFGVGGGIFDAHPGPNNPGKKGCEFSLFCDWLGIRSDPAMHKIINYIAEADRGNAGHPMALGALAKILRYRWPNDPMACFEWQIDILRAKYEQQRLFCLAQEEYNEIASEEWLSGGIIGKEDILIVTIVSANELMNEVARDNGAAILIQKRPLDCPIMPGNVMVFTNRKFGISLAGVAAAIRKEEERLSGAPATTDREKLLTPNKMAGVLNWFYLQGNNDTLLNGSDSAPNTPATRIPLKVIREIVTANLERKMRHN